MSGGQRHTEPVDVHLILRRETGEGPEVLLSRRAGQVYATGLWHLPSGHLDGPHEDVVTALVREAREETGVVIDPADVRAAVTVHHRSPGGASRSGYFLEVRRWQGGPRIAEPDLCDAMDWVPLDALPEGLVAYCRAGLDAYAAGARLAVHFQLPGDTIGFDPGADRLRLVPDTATGVPEACADTGVGGAVAAGGGGAAYDTGWLPPEQYTETVPKATAFACLYFTDEQDRPLQLHSVYSPGHPWQLVGGTMDAGERPWDTAVRECVEETGLTVAGGPTRLLGTVFGLPGAQWPYSTIGLVFDGGRLTAEQIRAITLDPREHDEVRVLPLAEWKALMPPRDFERLTAVADARRTGAAAYFGTWDWDDE